MDACAASLTTCINGETTVFWRSGWRRLRHYLASRRQRPRSRRACRLFLEPLEERTVRIVSGGVNRRRTRIWFPGLCTHNAAKAAWRIS
jgi:hypothetical protein